MKSSIFVIILVLSVFATDKPADPKWPDKFSQEFNEDLKYPILGTHKTSGKIFYDFTTKRYRVDRANGHYDRYCGANGFKLFQNTPCSHFVDENGDRYLHYPDKNECCFCCGADHGCSILKPTWLQGAQFLGEVDYQGVKAYKWNQPGLQANYYYETIDADPSKRVMLGIDQVPNDTQYYKKETLQLSVSENDLQLPSICKKENTCSFASVCTGLRKA